MASIINASTTSTSGLVQTADASGVLQLQSNGVTGLTVENTANVTVNTNLFVSGSEVEPLVLRTAQATTSGTAIEFAGIPSWIKRITVSFNATSLSGTSDILVQLGTSSGIVSTGYVASSLGQSSTPTSSLSTSTSGFIIRCASNSSAIYGLMFITLMDTNTFTSSHSGRQASNSIIIGGGSVTLPGILTQLRITTANGTDTFDAGSVNIMYE